MRDQANRLRDIIRKKNQKDDSAFTINQTYEFFKNAIDEPPAEAPKTESISTEKNLETHAESAPNKEIYSKAEIFIDNSPNTHYNETPSKDNEIEPAAFQEEFPSKNEMFSNDSNNNNTETKSINEYTEAYSESIIKDAISDKTEIFTNNSQNSYNKVSNKNDENNQPPNYKEPQNYKTNDSESKSNKDENDTNSKQNFREKVNFMEETEDIITKTKELVNSLSLGTPTFEEQKEIHSSENTLHLNKPILKFEEYSVQSNRVLTKPKLNARVIAVSSGKGGVGKTNFALNLAIEMTKQGKKIVIIDADFGLANIEVLFGIVPKYTLRDVLFGDTTFESTLTNGPLGLKFISGGSGFSELANMSNNQISYLLQSFEILDDIADIILIDTGAGLSKSVISFIQASSEAIIVTTPDPTAVTDAYAIIKTLKEDEASLPTIKILVNRVENLNEGEQIYKKLNSVSERFLNLSLENLGYIPYDNQLVKAVRRQEPVTTCFPSSISSKAIESISYKLLNMDIKDKSNPGVKSFMKKLVNLFGN